jgi:hypothetical protein
VGWLKVIGGGPAAWFTVTATLPIVIVACRAAPVFSATLKVTVPGPVWPVPEVIEMNDWFVVTVHAQEAVVETKMFCGPPPKPTSTVCCGTVMAHVVGLVGELLRLHDATTNATASSTSQPFVVLSIRSE